MHESEDYDKSLFDELVKPSELKPAYEDFCRYMVLTGGNKSESQRLAGFSPKSGCKQARFLLERPEIRARYAELLDAWQTAKALNFFEAFKAVEGPGALILQARIASQNLTPYIKDDLTLDIQAMVKDEVIIKRYKTREVIVEQGGKKTRTIYTEVELPDQLKANEGMLKLTGAVEDKPTEVHVIISPEEDFSKAGRSA